MLLEAPAIGIRASHLNMGRAKARGKVEVYKLFIQLKRTIMTDLYDSIMDAPIITQWKEEARKGDIYALYSLAQSAWKRYPGSLSICDKKTAKRLCQAIAEHPHYPVFRECSGTVFNHTSALNAQSEAARIEQAIQQHIIRDRIYDLDENRPWTPYELEQIAYQINKLQEAAAMTCLCNNTNTCPDHSPDDERSAGESGKKKENDTLLPLAENACQ